MKVIEAPIGLGKTTELIEFANNKKGYIVCHSRDEAHRISKLATFLDKNIFFPITYTEFEQYHGFPMEFYFDNYDMYIKNLFNRAFPNKNLKAVTLSENFNILDLIKE